MDWIGYQDVILNDKIYYKVVVVSIKIFLYWKKNREVYQRIENVGYFDLNFEM